MNSHTAGFQNALILFNANQLNEAQTLCLRLHRESRNDHHVLHLLGLIDTNLGNFDNAEQWLHNAVEISPNDARIRFHFAKILLNNQKLNKAIQNFREVIRLQPQFPDAHAHLADTLASKGLMEEAEQSYHNYIKLCPANADYHVNLGIVQEKLHKLDEAFDNAMIALKLIPDHIRAVMLLAFLEIRKKNYRRSEALLRKVLSSTQDPQIVATAALGLGRVLDKLKRYKEASDAFIEGKSAWMSLGKKSLFKNNGYLKRIDKIHRWSVNFNFNNWSTPKYAEERRLSPIFFVGFPRSGTTLTEQILNCCDEIVSTDEKPLLWKTINSINAIAGSDAPYPLCMENLSVKDLQELRDEYWKHAEHAFGKSLEGKQLVDKLPLNICDLGFVYRLFPDAKILVAIRDPRDVCLSCFMQDFRLNPAMANFCNMESTIRLYVQVMSLWLEYSSALPLNSLEYRYEDLVSNFDEVTKRIFKFLGLKWTNNIKNYHSKKTGYIDTPSYIDVSTPIYKDSTQRWKQYENLIAPHIEQLKPFINEFGYL